MDEPTLEQQIKFLDGAIGPDSIPAATIRRHAELVRLCREWANAESEYAALTTMAHFGADGSGPARHKAHKRAKNASAALVAAIGKEPK